jgi:hypothetical protein
MLYCMKPTLDKPQDIEKEKIEVLKKISQSLNKIEERLGEVVESLVQLKD